MVPPHNNSSTYRGPEDDSAGASSGCTLVVISQVYLPDPASVGQHMSDVAAEMARRGHRVIVYTSNRGYDDPSQRFASREQIEGVEVRRMPFCSFGKSSFILRMIAAASFTAQAAARALTVRRLSGVLVSTSPPLCGIAALLVRWLRNVPFTYWVMDLNPDQLIALNGVQPGSLPARVLDALNRAILKRASMVVALDRFMGARLDDKVELGSRLRVIAPWPHENHLEPIEHSRNPFRVKHGLQNKFVLMYSGNHSASNPLTTMLEAAVRLKDDPDLVFMFIGGGLGKREVEEYISCHHLTNVRSLPYEPLANLRFSLSAADVHIVSMGDRFVGIIHPCKVYGAMASARPILFLGPGPSHVSEILDEHRVGWQIAHGDVDGAVQTIRTIRSMSRGEVESMGWESRRALNARFSQGILCPNFCDDVEIAMFGSAGHAAAERGRVACRRTSTLRDNLDDSVDLGAFAQRS